MPSYLVSRLGPFDAFEKLRISDWRAQYVGDPGSQGRQDELLGGFFRQEDHVQQGSSLPQRRKQSQDLGDAGRRHRQDGQVDVWDSCDSGKLQTVRDTEDIPATIGQQPAPVSG